MKFILNYSNGSLQWSDGVSLEAAASLIQAGVLGSLIDVENKQALIGQVTPQNKIEIGWVNIPEFEDINPEVIQKLHETKEN